MDAYQAKHIDFPGLLSCLGFEPVRMTKGGRELWYRSPFRSEKEPSFHTSFLNGKWIWNDFGDTGGNVIDFVMRYEGFQTLQEVLAYLRKVQRNDWRQGLDTNQVEILPSSKRSHQFPDKPERQLEFIEAHPIRTSMIYEYLIRERDIPKKLADLYLEEVKYWNKTKGKQFFGFGMKNRSGGYEIRSASNKYNFKSALNGRDITVIPGSKTASKTVGVFEGMTDFLSFLVLTDVDHCLEDVIIMHSVSSYNRTKDFVLDRGYSKIKLFLDNNPSGVACSNRFMAKFGELVVNHSDYFAPHTDLNDALRAGHLLSKRQSNDPELNL